jgi:hypothetical protein
LCDFALDLAPRAILCFIEQLADEHLTWCRQLTLADDFHLHVRFSNGQAAAIIRDEMELVDAVAGHVEKAGELKPHAFIARPHGQIKIVNRSGLQRFQPVEIRQFSPLAAFITSVIQSVHPIRGFPWTSEKLGII